jgi:hypothetical protein
MFLLTAVGRVSYKILLLAILLDITGNNVDLNKYANRSAMKISLLMSAFFAFRHGRPEHPSPTDLAESSGLSRGLDEREIWSFKCRSRCSLAPSFAFCAGLGGWFLADVGFVPTSF